MRNSLTEDSVVEFAMSEPTPDVPNLGELMTRYLERRADACAVGIAAAAEEMTPYEAGPVQPVDARLAWDEALAVFTYGDPAVSTRGWMAPPGWVGLVAGHEPVLGIALCAGNFPQLLRSFHMLLQTAELTAPRSASRPAAEIELAPWADSIAERKQPPQLLLGLGVLRLARQLDAAKVYVQKLDAGIPATWRTAWENERAALAWHAGRAEEALAKWQQLQSTTPVLFNRGMAQLFLGQTAAAREHLSAAVARLPETGAWHHLGRLYLTLAQGR
jgi:tetratricopeptide (TPR) repeat protein